jgi:CheY-like chemotaxis protein
MEPKESQKVPRRSSEQKTAQVKILIVEDVPNVSTVMKARLESFDNYVCAVANTGL